MKEMWVRALTCGKAKRGWKVVGPEAEGCPKQEIWAGASESQEPGGKQQGIIFL